MLLAQLASEAQNLQQTKYMKRTQAIQLSNVMVVIRLCSGHLQIRLEFDDMDMLTTGVEADTSRLEPEIATVTMQP